MTQQSSRSYDGLPRSARPHPARYLLYPLRPLGRAVIRRRIKVRHTHREKQPSSGPVLGRGSTLHPVIFERSGGP